MGKSYYVTISNPIGRNLFKWRMTFGRWFWNRDENYFSMRIYSWIMWFIQAWSVHGRKKLNPSIRTHLRTISLVSLFEIFVAKLFQRINVPTSFEKSKTRCEKLPTNWNFQSRQSNSTRRFIKFFKGLAKWNWIYEGSRDKRHWGWSTHNLPAKQNFSSLLYDEVKNDKVYKAGNAKANKNNHASRYGRRKRVENLIIEEKPLKNTKTWNTPKAKIGMKFGFAVETFVGGSALKFLGTVPTEMASLKGN